MPATPPTSPEDLRALRRELRARRRAVPAGERRRAAHRLASRVERAGWLSRGLRIALFLSLPEEIDTAPLIARAGQRGCRIHLPRVTDYQRSRMQFFRLRAGLVRGRYGILEPRPGLPTRVSQLDVVLMPLVGFDLRGNRIGMGKGYYDRALGFRRTSVRTRQPLLVGLAYECQRVDALPVRTHDVPLDRLVTERVTRRFR
jgi:5-formyltetrahydrofolate cyclo-ligase